MGEILLLELLETSGTPSWEDPIGHDNQALPVYLGADGNLGCPVVPDGVTAIVIVKYEFHIPTIPQTVNAKK